MTTIQITLPDQLAQEAQRAGLLSQAAIGNCCAHNYRRSAWMNFL